MTLKAEKMDILRFRLLLRKEFMGALMILCLMNHSVKAIKGGPPRKLAIADDRRILLASQGSPFMLRCPVEMSTSPYVDWSKGNTSLYIEEGYEINERRGALKLKNVTKQNEGSYTCHATNGYGTVSINLTLIVDDSEVNRNSTRQIQNTTRKQQGILPSFKKRQMTTVSEEIGRSVTLHCTAQGQPSPYIFWVKEGVLKNEAKKDRVHSTLTIHDLKKSDAGIYRCIAKNKIGEAYLDFSLQVTDPVGPPKIVALTPLTATIKTSVTAVFSCDVYSKPGLNLHIKWFKRLTDDEMRESHTLDDITLFRSDSLYYRPLNISESIVTQEGVYKSKLLIQEATEDDSGTYVCFALNDKGFIFKNVTLNVVTTAIHIAGTPYQAVINGLSFAMPIVILLVSILALIIVVLVLRCKTISAHKRATCDVPSTCAERESLKQHVIPIGSHSERAFPFVKCDDAIANISSKAFYAYDHTETRLPKALPVKSSVR